VAPRAGVATASEADDAARRRAKKLFDRGEKLFALGRFAEALSAYQKAFEEFPAPEFLFNIGQCHRNLGNVDRAIFSFRKYLRLRPDADNREAVETLIAELEAEQRERERARPVTPPPPPPPGRTTPIYKAWWFWTGVAVVAGGVTAIAIATSDDGGLPASDFGNIPFGK
jgi:hypothetical protein